MKLLVIFAPTLILLIGCGTFFDPSLQECYDMMDKAYDTELECIRSGYPCPDKGYQQGYQAGVCARKVIDSCSTEACESRLTKDWLDYVGQKHADLQRERK